MQQWYLVKYGSKDKYFFLQLKLCLYKTNVMLAFEVIKWQTSHSEVFFRIFQLHLSEAGVSHLDVISKGFVC